MRKGVNSVRTKSIRPRPRRLTREQSRNETRMQIIEASAKIFIKRGYDAASVDEITESAGFSRGAFYSNFSSKEDLLLALLERSHIRDRDEMCLALDQKQSPQVQLGRLKELILDQVGRREIYLLFLEFKLAALRTPPLLKKWTKLQRIHRAEVQKNFDTLFSNFGLKSKAVTSGIFVSLAAYLEGIITQCALDPESVSEKSARKYVETIWDRVLEELNLKTPE